MKRGVIPRAILLAISTSAAGAQRAPDNMNVITATRLRTYLSVIASDTTEGRGTPSRGLDATAQFIVSHLLRLGLRPAGDNGSWFQTIPVHRNRIDSLKTSIELDGKRFQYGEDFIV